MGQYDPHWLWHHRPSLSHSADVSFSGAKSSDIRIPIYNAIITSCVRVIFPNIFNGEQRVPHHTFAWVYHLSRCRYDLPSIAYDIISTITLRIVVHIHVNDSICDSLYHQSTGHDFSVRTQGRIPCGICSSTRLQFKISPCDYFYGSDIS